MISYQKAKELNKAGFRFPDSMLLHSKTLLTIRKRTCVIEQTAYIDLPDANELMKLLPRGYEKDTSQGFQQQSKWVELIIKKVTGGDEIDYDVAGYFSNTNTFPAQGDIWFCNSVSNSSFEDVLVMLILKLAYEGIIKP